MDLLGAEVLAIYPAWLTTGKRLEKVAALCGAIQKVSSRQTRAVFCDFPCADIPPDLYKKMIRTEGKKYGLSADNLLFTSDIGYPLGFPREGVMELFQLSNLFICPSYSESFGLTVLEAASRGNFLVLNQAVPALQELGGENWEPTFSAGMPGTSALTPGKPTILRNKPIMRTTAGIFCAGWTAIRHFPPRPWCAPITTTGG